MDNFWKGTLAPISKHIEGVEFIDLNMMSAEDWEILDYEELRPAAKANVDKQINDCSLNGFYKVTYDQHLDKVHGGKKRYYYPTDGDQFDGVDGDKAIAEFGNFDKFDEDAESPESFKEKFAEISKLSTARLRTIAIDNGVPRRRAVSWPRVGLVLFAIKATYCTVEQQEEELEEGSEASEEAAEEGF